MEIKSLQLQNFRNYPELLIEFDEKTNIIYGDNAQGKTNILEAVYLSSTSRSHKGAKDKEMIRFGEDEAHIKMIIRKNGIDHRIDLHIRKNKSKGIAIDGVSIRKASELFGLIHVIIFSPEDLSMVKNGPAERRRFMDLELCQLDKLYTSELSGYNKVLNDRNRMLKDLWIKPEYEEILPLYDIKLVNFGKHIIEAREKFISRLNDIVKEIHYSLTGGKEELVISYEPNVQGDRFEEELMRGAERDRHQKVTLTGPHRDDICFLANGIDLRKFGSQGQQRSAALSLKLAEIELVKSLSREYPVLLLDDVLSELDSSRQENLLGRINHIQTIMTCTGLDEFVKNRLAVNKIFHVMDNKVGGYQ
ncbi:MAG: DNA replication/repair protein RecF [Lachnospiraceae bacterium]|nr:DNA replication/repair protein RecF [Lachnospiraceae bacterium]